MVNERGHIVLLLTIRPKGKPEVRTQADVYEVLRLLRLAQDTGEVFDFDISRV